MHAERQSLLPPHTSNEAVLALLKLITTMDFDLKDFMSSKL